MIFFFLSIEILNYDSSFDGKEKIYFRYEKEALSIKKNHKEKEKLFSASREVTHLFDKLGKKIIFETNNNSVFTLDEEIPESMKKFVNETYENSEFDFSLFYNVNSPSFPEQYSLKNTGQYGGIEGEDINVIEAWNNGYFGKGVNITIVDNGCDYNSDSYKDRFDLNNTWHFSDDCVSIRSKRENCNNARPNPTELFSFHGTSCAAIAAGSLSDKCGAGIAPHSRVTCQKMESQSEKYQMKNLLASITRLGNADIKSNSWGDMCRVDLKDMIGYCPHGIISQLYRNAVNKVIAEGRNGLGEIVVFAAGNEGHYGDDASFKQLHNERQVISVAASTNEGRRAFYSSRGNSILVNAPSGGRNYFYMNNPDIPGISTTVNDNQCTKNFTGTSAAAPAVSGVIALILGVNPRLSWRDVQIILAMTSTVNDPTCPSWHKNAAGFYYSPYYGFGRVNAGKATKVAKNWINVENETRTFSANYDIDVYQCRSSTRHLVFDVNESIETIETVEVECHISSNIEGFLVFTLISPSGTKAVLKEPSIHDPHALFNAPKAFVSRDFLGESSKGKWKMEIKTVGCIEAGNIKFISLNINGIKTKNNNIRSMQSIGKDPNTNIKMQKSKSFWSKTKRISCYCNETIKINMGFDKTMDNYTVAVFLINKNQKRLFLCNRNISTTIEINVPCIFQNMNCQLSIDAPFLNESCRIPIKIHSRKGVYEEGIITPKRFSVIRTSKSNETTLSVKWQHLMDDFPSSLWGNNVIYSLFDAKKQKTVLLRRGINTGNATFVFEKGFQCRHCTIVITPVYHSSDSTCTTLTLPVHIIDESKKVPKNIEPFGFDPCSNRMIKAKNISSFVHWFKYDIINFVNISSLFVISLLLILKSIKKRKQMFEKLQKSDEDILLSK